MYFISLCVYFDLNIYVYPVYCLTDNSYMYQIIKYTKVFCRWTRDFNNKIKYKN